MALPKLDVPIYETKLIANGKTVRFRPFLVKEQKILLMASQSDDAKETINAIKQILTNCILSDDINVDELSSFDLEYLFLNLRAKSVGENVNLKYTCNNKIPDDSGNEVVCGGVVKFDINLLDVKPEIPEGHSPKIQLTDKLGLMMKYPNFKNIGDLDMKGEQDVFELVSTCIDYIYDEDNIYYAKDSTKEEMLEFVESMQQSDFEKINLFFSTMPKLSKEVHFKCPKCKYEENITIEGIQSFFE